MSIFGKIFSKEKESKEDLDKGLEKTKEGLFSKLSKAVVGKSTVDEEILDDVEEALMIADVGLETTIKIIDRLEARVVKDKYIGINQLYSMLKDEIVQMISESESVESKLAGDNNPHVILVVGVNGVGKTTTIGKLANKYKEAGKKVLLGAADTFRAAAVDQLNIWAERVDVDIVNKGMNTDPASVAFETVKEAVDKNADVVIIDTAGRLHNKINLMNELSKIRRVIQKVIPEAPHEVLLVLDASTGQNAVEQAKQFTKATEVNALALTKLDGTAKGGVILSIVDQFKIPIKYIGVGEQMHHLQIFDEEAFVDSLFSNIH